MGLGRASAPQVIKCPDHAARAQVHATIAAPAQLIERVSRPKPFVVEVTRASRTISSIAVAMSLGSHGTGRSGTWRALSIMRRAIFGIVNVSIFLRPRHWRTGRQGRPRSSPFANKEVLSCARGPKRMHARCLKSGHRCHPERAPLLLHLGRSAGVSGEARGAGEFRLQRVIRLCRPVRGTPLFRTATVRPSVLRQMPDPS